MSLPIYAGYYLSGNDLQTDCRERSKFIDGRDHNPCDVGSCRTYIVSVADSHNAYVDWGYMSPRFCSPDKVTQGQLAAVVIKYLEANPQDLHLAAAGIVVNALAQAFPCN